MNKETFQNLNISNWLNEGCLLQTENHFLIGEGPFTSHTKEQKGFYCPNYFFQKKQPWIKPKTLFCLSKEAFENLLHQIPESPLALQLHQPPSFVEFQTAFYQIQKEIKKKHFQKIVPFFYENLKGTLTATGLLKNIHKKNFNQGFLFGMWNSQSGLLGYTPEILFSKHENKIHCMALAGTSSLYEKSLFKNTKEKEEQNWVIQDLKDSLKKKVSWQSFQHTEKTYGSIKHLCTHMNGTLSLPLSFSSLCKQIHPTAALGGYPKKEALHWLLNHPQQKNRTDFAAPFGFSNGKGKGFCVVAIRALKWTGNKVQLGSGCGLIQKSSLQKEWRELFLKREAVKNFFNLKIKSTDSRYKDE